MKPTRQSGVALVMTLIFLSVITILAVAFLALSRRGRVAIRETTNRTVTEEMADIALERAKGDILLPILATNPVHSDLLGPGYASAYGLVMLVHHRPVDARDGTVFHQNGIRTHGSVNYQSITNGDSHGCHRLFNHAAVQLASFLLQHRRHVRHGVLDRPFTHEFTWRGIRVRHPIAHRGYRFELTPPVEVEVLPGIVRGKLRRVPLRLVSLPRPRSQPAQPEAVPALAPAATPPAADAAVQGKPPENPEWGREGG